MDTKSPSLSLLHRLAHIILVVLSPQQDLALFSLLKPTVSMSGISLTSLISQVYSSTSHRAPSCTVNSSISSMSTISSTWHMVIKTMVRSSCKRSHQTSKTSLKTKRRSSMTSGHVKSRNVSSSLSRENKRRSNIHLIKLRKKRERPLQKHKTKFLKMLFNRENLSRKTHTRICCLNTRLSSRRILG